MRDMIPRLVLVLCLAGNVVLAFILLRPATAQNHLAAPVEKTSSGATVKTISAPAVSSENISPEDLALFSVTNAADLSWSKFTLADYARYIRQLRTFGVPEARVREIILGTIESVYRPKRAALRPPPVKRDDTKFWGKRNFYGWQPRQSPEQREKLRALQKEETELVKSLFGADVYDLIAKDSGNDSGINWVEKMYGFIPKELREKVQDIEQRMNEETWDIQAQAQEDNDWQNRDADERKIQKKYREEIAKILTPEQLLEWDLRHSRTANQLKNDLSAFDPNEDEFRALFKYQQAMEQINPSRDPDSDAPQLTKEERQALNEKKKAAEDDLAALIGTNRVAEYKLEQDYSYRELIDGGVAKESVFKLADMRKEAENAARKIRQDKTLTPDQRKEALAAIRDETQNTIGQLLGDKFSKQYLNRNWWLNNIAPQSQPTPAQ
jgi:hypothetical protein